MSVVQPGPVKTKFRERVDEELDRYDRTDAYADIYEFQEDASLFGADSPVAVHPKDVARVILEAGVSPDPDPRYAVGGFADIMLKTRFLPDRVRDKMFGLVQKFT